MSKHTYAQGVIAHRGNGGFSAILRGDLYGLGIQTAGGAVAGGAKESIQPWPQHLTGLAPDDLGHVFQVVTRHDIRRVDHIKISQH